jgi:hypothetical protein
VRKTLERMRKNVVTTLRGKKKRDGSVYIRYDRRASYGGETITDGPIASATYLPNVYRKWRKDQKGMARLVLLKKDLAVKVGNSYDLEFFLNVVLFLGSIWNILHPFTGHPFQILNSDLFWDGRGSDRTWERIQELFISMFGFKIEVTK